MSEYTLTQSITSFNYPSHMKRPAGFFGSNFFEKWIPNWQTHLGHLSNKPNVIGIEIGVLNGDCTVFCVNEILNGEGSLLYAVDINCTDEFKHNIAPYQSKIDFRQGYSYDILRTLTNNGKNKQFADYVYVDGSHLAIDVLSDAVLAWSLLKTDGILIFDDYGWGAHTNDEKQKPKLAIDAFMTTYQDHYKVLQFGWQVFLQKLPYTYSHEELEANYQK